MLLSVLSHLPRVIGDKADPEQVVQVPRKPEDDIRICIFKVRFLQSHHHLAGSASLHLPQQQNDSTSPPSLDIEQWKELLKWQDHVFWWGMCGLAANRLFTILTDRTKEGVLIKSNRASEVGGDMGTE
ncbi:hypothetical protein BLNAU_8602 [Blattamonas nauphoetae]|uniref:Uncharacterized protein n=1 Tax=Blattamonas nauphoetae TaxID=2049346 RepID=A0ABQ9XY34_9EUKA|nr:hypothetical protein BLNAU_8602 [Blattamonas nauphoetae]